MTKRRLSISQPILPAKRFSVNKVTFDDGMEAINNAIRYLDSNNVDTFETIQQATVMLKDLEEARANLFGIRARSLGRQGGFEKAIADAYKAIDASPTSGQFYQLAGELHIAHGKPKLAVDALENGLRSTLPSDWPSLYNQREAATRSLEAKVDFVSILPPEVTGRIVMCLNEMDSRGTGAFNCTLVSRRWRAVVLGCSKLWKIAEHRTFSNETFALLLSVSHYVEEIYIDELSKRPTLGLIKLATRGRLRSVTKLTLGDYRRHIDCYLLSALGKQITELKLNYTPDNDLTDVFSIGEILAMCTSLKALTVLHEGQMIYYRPFEIPPVDTVELEMLSLSARFYSGDLLQQLIPRCPQLRYLNIAHCPLDALDLLTEPYSQLEEICITTAEDSHVDIWEKVCQKCQQPTTGLRKLEFISGEYGIRLRDTVPLLIGWKNTLQELIIEMCDDDIETMEPMHWDSLVSGPYPQLKSLRLVSTDGDGSQVANHVLRLLQSCPNLEDVSLYIENMMSNDLFTRFDALSYLRRLQISYLETCGGLRQCFESLSTNQRECNLKEISINFCEAVTDQILIALADVPSLEVININGPHDLVSPNGVKAFLRKLKSNPHLKYLAFRFMTNFTEDCIAKLNELLELNGVANKCKIRKLERYDGVDCYDVILDVQE